MGTTIRRPATGEVKVLNTSGAVFGPAKERFLALCEIFPERTEVLRVADQLVGWPIKKYATYEGERASKTAPGTLMRPSARIIDLWWGAWLAGDAKAKPETVEMMRKRADAYDRMGERLTRRGAFEAARKMQEQVMDGSITQPQLYKYTHDGAGFLAASLREGGTQAPIQIGKLNINAGPKPVKAGKKPMRLQEGFLEGEWKEVPSS